MKNITLAALAALCLSQCEQSTMSEEQMSAGACKLFSDNQGDPKLYKPLISQALNGDGKKSWTIATLILAHWGGNAHAMEYDEAEKLRRLGAAWMQQARRQDSPLAIIDCLNCVNGLTETPDFADAEKAQEAREEAKKLLLAIPERDETEERYLKSLGE